MNGFFAFVVLGLLAVAAAYDYSDEVYNQMIKQEMDDLETLLDAPDFTNVHRRKREEDKTCKRRWKMCCGEEAIEKMVHKDRELKKECFKEIMAKAPKEEKSTNSIYDPFSCEKIQKIKKEWTCVIECVGQKKNILDKDGNILEDKIIEMHKEDLAGHEWFFELAKSVFPKCMEEVKKATTFVKDESDPLSCNPVPIRMRYCIWKELQLACPDDKITDKKVCDKIREKIEKHDFLPFHHHHHDDD